jgi:4a-hydroxytetrahydrobiopterin dehydratase
MPPASHRQPSPTTRAQAGRGVADGGATTARARSAIRRKDIPMLSNPFNELAQKTCTPCQGGVAPLHGVEVQRLLDQLGGGWQAVNDHHLLKEFRFKDFREALDFTVEVGEVAETEGHHPDIYLGWGRVRITIWTHKIDGLTESDFILAAKIEARYPASSPAI